MVMSTNIAVPCNSDPTSSTALACSDVWLQCVTIQLATASRSACGFGVPCWLAGVFCCRGPVLCDQCIGSCFSCSGNPSLCNWFVYCWLSPSTWQCTEVTTVTSVVCCFGGTNWCTFVSACGQQLASMQLVRCSALYFGCVTRSHGIRLFCFTCADTFASTHVCFVLLLLLRRPPHQLWCVCRNNKLCFAVVALFAYTCRLQPPHMHHICSAAAHLPSCL
jgi:hypothetical protein